MFNSRFLTPVFLLMLCLGGAGALAQATLLTGEVEEARSALARAERESEAATKRARLLEAEARRVTEEAERTAREAAALAARIQEAEADISATEARNAIIAREQGELRAALAERQLPLIRLTAALQRLSRRPPILALLRPGSVRDTMHLRALLETMMPEVERRTIALRADIARGRALERQASAAAARLRAEEAELAQRKRALAAVETRQRLASRRASGVANREADRALALAEEVRTLGELVDEFGRQGETREQLAQLPGPLLRPQRPEASEVIEATVAATASEFDRYILPLTGRLVAGFGDAIDGRPQSRGIVLAARPNAQAVAPAPGRVAFASRYRGYGHIVIIEHPGGWTTLVTGLARLDTAVGDNLVEGSPLGQTGPGDPIVTVELRREGEPVNPLQFVQSL